MLIYLDNAATSYPKPNILAESLSYSMLNFVIPIKDSHSIFNNSYDAVIETRDNLADYFNIGDSSKLIFTPGGSYSNYLYLNSIKWNENDVIVYSSLEHNSIYKTLLSLKDIFNVKLVKLNYLKHKGFDLAELEHILNNNNVKLLVLTHASNVTGEILPIRKVLELKEKYNFKLFVNASQTVGVFPIDLEELKIDALAFSCHKNLLGIPGVGALYVSDIYNFTPAFGFYSEGKNKLSRNKILKFEPIEYVTNNLPAIWALNASLCYLKSIGLEKIYQHKRELTRSAVEAIQKNSGISCYSSINNNVGIVSFNLIDKKPKEVANILDKKYNICVNSGLLDSILVHQAIETEPEGCIRFSFSYFNSKEDLKLLLVAIKEISETL